MFTYFYTQFKKSMFASIFFELNLYNLSKDVNVLYHLCTKTYVLYSAYKILNFGIIKIFTDKKIQPHTRQDTILPELWLNFSLPISASLHTPFQYTDSESHGKLHSPPFSPVPCQSASFLRSVPEFPGRFPQYGSLQKF